MQQLADVYKHERNAAFTQLGAARSEVGELKTKLAAQTAALGQSYEYWRRWATDVDEMHRGIVTQISAYAEHWRPFIRPESVAAAGPVFGTGE
uniref:Uncharacterized protein n=1 Tax=Mycena chlorophos TaxID=658473 RepID=A0ABQ0LXJ0_MYCCL|nr:predicted protein [Mycena chlorophos]